MAASHRQGEGKRIAILTGAPLSQNPRVMKEATTLAGAGLDVLVLGTDAGGSGLARDLR
jgi:hypothetical protein